jgi:hypothetical protein
LTFAARLAGRIAASIPAMTATIVNATSWPQGTYNPMSSSASALEASAARNMPSGSPQRLAA